MIDYYDVLEISPNANEEVVKKSYHKLIQQYQPERFHSAYKQYSTQRLKLIEEAYQILSNVEKRRKYDLKLAKHTRINSPLKSKTSLQSIIIILCIALLVFLLSQVVIALLKSVAIAGSLLLKVILPLFVLLVIILMVSRKHRFIKK